MAVRIGNRIDWNFDEPLSKLFSIIQFCRILSWGLVRNRILNMLRHIVLRKIFGKSN
jgi:hypothetical protein